MLINVLPSPGVFTEDTDFLTGPRWVAADKVRFRAGIPQKLGGWQSELNTFRGTVRALHVWDSLTGDRYIGAASECDLQIFRGGSFSLITPLRVASAPLGTDPFATTISSNIITVTDVSHGAVTGDTVIIAGPVAVGGVSLDGEYILTKVTDDTYTIVDDQTASSTAVGGTGTNVEYTINCGNASATGGYGWGAGPYSGETWGTERSQIELYLPLELWTLDNWGEDLIAGRRGSALYFWDSSLGVGQRATQITAGSAPTEIGIFKVSTPDRHAVVFGSNESGTFDPMLVQWSDQEDFNVWVPTATNTAGSFRLASGNTIVAVRKTKSHILIWTDTAMYSMQFLGPPFTFGFDEIATEISSVGHNSSIVVGSVAYWMGTDNFYQFDGSASELPCTVRNHVFNNFNSIQREKVVAGRNTNFNEIWWHYPSENSEENDSYVIYNYSDRTWTIGTIERTAWFPFGTSSKPIAVNSVGKLYTHEITANDDSAAMPSSIRTGSFQISSQEMPEGEHFAFINKLLPDVKNLGSAILNVSISTKRYPNSTQVTTKGPFEILSTTEKLNFRARGREWEFTYSSDDMDNAWRLGKWRLNVKPDGKR